MPHVDEGTLHAYLDGELPSAEHKTVETHLAECASCHASLVEQRALIERASALLGTARPAERAAPPFEQLRPRSSKRSPWRIRTPVAWAASIALAVGLGYVLRGSGPNAALYRAEQRTEPQAAVIVDEPAPATAPAAGGQDSERRTQARRFEQGRRPTPSSDVAVAVEKSRGDSVTAYKFQDAPGALAVKTAPQLRNSNPSAAHQRVADSTAAAQRVPDSLVSALEEAVVTAAPTIRSQPTTTRWPIISRGTARTLLGADPVGLPGLATRRIRRSPAPNQQVVVEQALDSSTTIEIYQRPADAPVYVDGVIVRQERESAAREAAPAAAPAPADRLARYVGKLRVEIAGPLSTDSLNKLLDQVKPLP